MTFSTTANSGSTTTEKMTILGNGNVGVGTTNPTTTTEIQRIETVNRANL